MWAGGGVNAHTFICSLPWTVGVTSCFKFLPTLTALPRWTTELWAIIDRLPQVGFVRGCYHGNSEWQEDILGTVSWQWGKHWGKMRPAEMGLGQGLTREKLEKTDLEWVWLAEGWRWLWVGLLPWMEATSPKNWRVPVHPESNAPGTAGRILMTGISGHVIPLT